VVMFRMSRDLVIYHFLQGGGGFAFVLVPSLAANHMCIGNTEITHSKLHSTRGFLMPQATKGGLACDLPTT